MTPKLCMAVSANLTRIHEHQHCNLSLGHFGSNIEMVTDTKMEVVTPTFHKRGHSLQEADSLCRWSSRSFHWLPSLDPAREAEEGKSKDASSTAKGDVAQPPSSHPLRMSEMHVRLCKVQMLAKLENKKVYTNISLHG